MTTADILIFVLLAVIFSLMVRLRRLKQENEKLRGETSARIEPVVGDGSLLGQSWKYDD